LQERQSVPEEPLHEAQTESQISQSLVEVFLKNPLLQMHSVFSIFSVEFTGHEQVLDKRIFSGLEQERQSEKVEPSQEAQDGSQISQNLVEEFLKNPF
jgi:hypothetical protein